MTTKVATQMRNALQKALDKTAARTPLTGKVFRALKSHAGYFKV